MADFDELDSAECVHCVVRPVRLHASLPSGCVGGSRLRTRQARHAGQGPPPTPEPHTSPGSTGKTSACGRVAAADSRPACACSRPLCMHRSTATDLLAATAAALSLGRTTADEALSGEVRGLAAALWAWKKLGCQQHDLRIQAWFPRPAPRPALGSSGVACSLGGCLWLQACECSHVNSGPATRQPGTCHLRKCTNPHLAPNRAALQRRRTRTW